MKNTKIHFFGYLVLILLGSSIPGESMPPIMALTWDKMLHVIEYSLVGFLGIRAFYSHLKNPVIYGNFWT